MYYEKAEGMTSVIDEDVKNIPVWYRCIKFYTFA